MNEINDMLQSLKKQTENYIKSIIHVCENDLTKQANELRAIERSGETSDAKLLLHLLVIYAVSGVSFRLIAVLGYLMNAVAVSDEAWRQRFLKCSAWILFLLQNSLNTVAPTSLMFCNKGREMQVYVVDATMFKQVGSCGKELRVHMCYNLTRGVMEEVMVTDNRDAESASKFSVQPGSLYMADAGYGKGVNAEYISSQNGYVLFRITPHLVRLSTDAEGKNVIDMTKMLKTKKKRITFDCYIHTKKGHYLPIRIIASRLPEDKALLAKERKMRISNRKQRKLKPATLEYCQWVILMTNIGEEHSPASLLDLYRCRWQIELLFKRIKQFFSIKRLKKASLEHSKLLVLLWLLIWSAVERKSIAAEIRLIESGKELNLYSPWVMSALVFKQLLTIVNAFWALSFDPAFHATDVFIFTRNHKSKRFNQYAFARLLA